MPADLELQPLRGKVVEHGGQDDAVLEECLEHAQDGGEAAGGAGGTGDQRVPVTAEPALGDLDVGGVLPGEEAELHGRGLVAVAPVEQHAAVVLDLLDGDVGGDAVHLPVPADLRAGRQPAAAAGEPEPGGDGGGDHRLEHPAWGPADGHSHLYGRDLCEAKIIH